MNDLSVIAQSYAAQSVMMWATPLIVIFVCTAVGWIVERIVISWARGMSRRITQRHESVTAHAVRGHITFWGLLLGVGLATQQSTSTTAPAGGFHSLFLQLAFQLDLSPSVLAEDIRNVLVALFVISLTLMLARLFAGLIVASATQEGRQAVSLVSNIVTLAVFAVGFLLVLSVFQVTITPLLTALGVGGLAAGLALQATLTDLVSGVLLLGSRQIQPGQYVKLSTGEEGYVTDVTWRTTTIRQLSNNLVIVPNSKMTSTSVTNYHTPIQNLSVSVSMTVGFNNDLDKVERVTTDVAREVMREVKGGVPEFEPFIRYNTQTDYSVGFSVIMQGKEVTDQYLITHEFIKRIRRRYRDEGISVPVPLQSVQLRDVQGEPLALTPSGSRPATDIQSADHGSAPGTRPQASALSSDASSR